MIPDHLASHVLCWLLLGGSSFLFLLVCFVFVFVFVFKYPNPVPISFYFHFPCESASSPFLPLLLKQIRPAKILKHTKYLHWFFPCTFWTTEALILTPSWLHRVPLSAEPLKSLLLVKSALSSPYLFVSDSSCSLGER